MKMTRYNLFLRDKKGGNGLLKWVCDDVTDSLINIIIIMLSLDGELVLMMTFYKDDGVQVLNIG